MTHHTDAARAEFEAWARGYGTWEVKRDDDVVLGTTGYTDITLTVAWHAVQAAHRAPAAPVPQGWKLVPAVPTFAMLDAIHGVCSESGKPMQSKIDAADHKYASMLVAAPQPPEAHCQRCEGSGEDPEGFYDQSRGPDGDTHAGPCRNCGGNGAAAPVQLPEPVANLWQHGETGRTRVVMPDAITDCDARWQHVGALYTEQQVRELLANHDIQEQST